MTAAKVIKTLTLRIDCCANCPKLIRFESGNDWGGGSYDYYCKFNSKANGEYGEPEIMDENSIPSWCPLESVKENTL